MKAIINGKIILKDRVVEDMALLYSDVIEGVVPCDKVPADAQIIDACGGYVSPGLIDIHIHGYLSKDVCDGEADSIRTIAGGIVKNGVTGFLPTTMTVDMAVIRKALEVCRDLKEESKTWAGSQILGCHAEGPFISESKKGAQDPKYILKPDAKFVKEYATNLFAHEYVLRLLSHNIFNKHIETGKEVMGYSTLLHQIESHGPQYVAQFQEDLKRLIATYRKWSEKDHEPFVLGETTEERINQLFNLVSQRMHDDAQKKFGQSIEFLGRGTFLKQRGSLGYLFNITHDFLILMTAVIVKDERMPFKTLLKEFEKRGVAFDRHSVEEIIAVFNSHNILDKKSDSGDAQYVKPIL